MPEPLPASKSESPPGFPPGFPPGLKPESLPAQIQGTPESCKTFIVTVAGYGSSGEGVARLDDGRVVFIRSAARGDVLEIRLSKAGTGTTRAGVTRAGIVRILSPSPNRIAPVCKSYPICGGCDFLHITYEEELRAKLRRVNDALERIGGLDIKASEILRTGQIDGYRNKVVLHSDGISAGFYRSGSHEIVPVDHCMLLKEDLNEALKGLPPGHGATLRSGLNGINPPLEEKLDDLVFGISGFFQINTGAALLLYQKAREYADIRKNERLVDLYCGVGALTLFVGRDAGYTLGIELDPASIKAARKNAHRNNLSHVEFLCADASDWDPGGHIPQCLIVDPPRKGLSRGVLQKILQLSPRRIVYVSCDPATLARDLKALTGYEAREICAVDMFPRTANVECCCLLERKHQRFSDDAPTR